MGKYRSLYFPFIKYTSVIDEKIINALSLIQL